MQQFVVSIAETASEQLEDLPVEIRLSLLKKIQALGESPFPRGTTIKRLKTKTQPALFRLRHSDYRAVYRIKGRSIEILEIVHRQELDLAVRRILHKLARN